MSQVRFFSVCYESLREMPLGNSGTCFKPQATISYNLQSTIITVWYANYITVLIYERNSILHKNHQMDAFPVIQVNKDTETIFQHFHVLFIVTNCNNSRQKVSLVTSIYFQFSKCWYFWVFCFVSNGMLIGHKRFFEKIGITIKWIWIEAV